MNIDFKEKLTELVVQYCPLRFEIPETYECIVPYIDIANSLYFKGKELELMTASELEELVCWATYQGIPFHWSTMENSGMVVRDVPDANTRDISEVRTLVRMTAQSLKDKRNER